jgi:hypothetical protein
MCRLDCCSCGVMESSAVPFRLRVILVFRDIIYVIIVFYSWHLVICEHFFSIWLLGFGIKIGYDMVPNLRPLAISRAWELCLLTSPCSSAPPGYRNTWGWGQCACRTTFRQPGWNRGASLTHQCKIKQYIWNLASAWAFISDAVSGASRWVPPWDSQSKPWRL